MIREIHFVGFSHKNISTRDLNSVIWACELRQFWTNCFCNMSLPPKYVLIHLYIMQQLKIIDLYDHFELFIGMTWLNKHLQDGGIDVEEEKQEKTTPGL